MPTQIRNTDHSTSLADDAPVRGKGLAVAGITVNGVDWLNGLPSLAKPRTSTECAPTGTSFGIVTVACTTPLLVAVSEASVTGSEWRIIRAADPGK